MRKGSDAISNGDFIDISFVTAKTRRKERKREMYIYIEIRRTIVSDPIERRNRSFKDFPVAPLSKREFLGRDEARCRIYGRRRKVAGRP